MWAGFVLGFFGSLHCLVMCGPVVMMIGGRTGFQKTVYHSGRILVYVGLGMITGFVGVSLQLKNFQNQVSIFSGVLIILIVVLPVFRNLIERHSPLLRVYQWVKSKALTNESSNQIGISLTSGLLNGLLPCGLTYAAVLGSLAAVDVFESAAFMMLFGVGTLPMLLSVEKIKNMVFPKVGLVIPKLITYSGVFVGILLIFRGLALGIPYLSPIEESCCRR